MPVHFTCPHCGNTTDVAEQYAGQSGPCARCGKTITVPPLSVAPQFYNQLPPRKPRSTAATILIVLAVALPVLLFCGGILTAILLPAVQAGRQAAKLANCQSNMRQIAFAMQAYHNQTGHFPPAYVADKDGKPMHSWRVLLLPYLGEQALYAQYNMNEPWNSPHNMALANQMPAIYHCPEASNTSPNVTNYLMLVGPCAISTGPKGRTKNEITDGLPNTIMVAESVGSNINWLDPRDFDAETMTFDLNDTGGNEMSSDHPTAVNVIFADGSVRILPKSTDADNVKAMTTIDGRRTSDAGGRFNDRIASSDDV